jgi:hypothetical protein
VGVPKWECEVRRRICIYAHATGRDGLSGKPFRSMALASLPRTTYGRRSYCCEPLQRLQRAVATPYNAVDAFPILNRGLAQVPYVPQLHNPEDVSHFDVRFPLTAIPAWAIPA